MTVSVLQRVACSWVKWEPGQLESPSPPVLKITPVYRWQWRNWSS